MGKNNNGEGNGDSNGRVSLAILKNEIEHIKNGQNEVKSELRDLSVNIQNFIKSNTERVSTNAVLITNNEKSINRLWLVIGIILTALVGSGCSYLLIR